MSEISNITPIKGTVTYTYDELDRVYLRNVYKDNVTKRARNPNRGSGNIGLSLQSPRVPKELIYQDIHHYDTNRGDLSHVKRIYKPIITAPTDVAGTITATVSSQSHVIAAGFHWSTDETFFLYKVVQPYTLNQIPQYWHSVLNIPFQNVITLTKTSAGVGFYKTFAIIETGTLFSPTLQIT